ncbi:MAG: TRL-like family protein [Treponema sp.]|jgi:outer membrane biogenesis lipoprotein LolB|nr:TRL-like family protein [Treponema sp.]
MKRLLVLIAVFTALVLMGCTTTVRYIPLAVTNNPIGTKVGVVDVNQGGAYAAAKNGGITKIATVEKRITQGAGKYVVEFVVTGE